MNTITMPTHYPIKVIETMGRNAGWLAAASALGKRAEDDPPHIILMPEQRFNDDRFLTQVEAVYRRLGYAVVIVSEAVLDETGQPLGAVGQMGADAFQHPLLSGAAQYLVNIVMKQLKVRARFDKPGDLQRMASNCISRTDRQEAYLVGQMGVRALLSGEHDKMITLVRHTEPEYQCTTDVAALERIANEQRVMPEAYLDESKTMVTPAFYDYALPLIGDALPHHAALATTRITKP